MYFSMLMKKGIKNKGNYIILFVLALFISFSYWTVYRIDDTFQIKLMNLEERVANYDRYIKQTETAGEDASDLIFQRENLAIMVEAYEKKEYQSYLKSSVAVLEFQLKNTPELKDERPIPGFITTEQEELLVNQALLEGKIAPEDPYFEIRGATFSYRMLSRFTAIIFVAGILLVCTPIAVSPFFKQLNIEKTYPLSNRKKLLLRTGGMWLFAVLIFILLGLFGYLIGGIITGFGSFNYPILNYLGSEFWVVPLWQVFLKAFVLLTFVFLSIILTVQLIAQLTKNSLVTLFVALLVIIGTYLLGIKIPELLDFILYLPTTYLDAFKIVEGVTGAIHGIPQLNLWSGIIVNSCYSLVLFSISLGLEKERRVD